MELLCGLNDNLFQLSKTIFKHAITDHTTKFSDLVSIQNGYAFKSSEYIDKKQLLVLRTKNIADNYLFNKSDTVYISHDSYKKYKKFSFNKFDSVLVMVGASLGKTGFLTSNVIPALQNQNMWRFRAVNDQLPGLLVFEYVNYINRRVKGTASGSARSFYRKKIFSDFNVPIVTSETFYTFEKLQNQIDSLQSETEDLYKLKKTLLNKFF